MLENLHKGLINIDKIIEFTKRRFPIDNHWIDGNCFFYAQILKSVWADGIIFYDVHNGHFIFKYNGKYYDWTGIIEPDGYLVEWDKFEEYDPLQKQVIIRDCIL